MYCREKVIYLDIFCNSSFIELVKSAHTSGLGYLEILNDRLFEQSNASLISLDFSMSFLTVFLSSSISTVKAECFIADSVPSIFFLSCLSPTASRELAE